MKRTPITRRTGLARSTKPMKRSRLRLQSAKKRATNRKLKPARDACKAEIGKCCLCGKRWSLQIHEMFGGSLRDITEADRRFWLCACSMCHLGKLQHMPKVQQLELKRRTDPDYFDLEMVNAVVSGGKGERFFINEVGQIDD